MLHHTGRCCPFLAFKRSLDVLQPRVTKHSLYILKILGDPQIVSRYPSVLPPASLPGSLLQKKMGRNSSFASPVPPARLSSASASLCSLSFLVLVITQGSQAVPKALSQRAKGDPPNLSILCCLYSEYISKDIKNATHKCGMLSSESRSSMLSEQQNNLA